MQPSPIFASALDRLKTDRFRYFGSGEVSLEAVAEHERRGSNLLHLRVRTPAERYGAFLKIYKKSNQHPDTLSRLQARISRDFDTTLSVHQTLNEDATLGAVYPIAVFPEHLTIVTREAPGIPLGRAIEDRVRWRRNASGIDDLLRIMHDTGRWLARFQTIGKAADAATLRLDDVLEYVDIRLHKLLHAQAISAADRIAVKDGIERRWQVGSPRELTLVPIHADYCLGNVLVDDGRIVVLDFAMTRTGAIYHDVSHMFLQLQLMQSKPWFRPPVVDRLCAALLEGFDPKLRQETWLFQILMIQHVVNHFTKLTIRPARRAIARPYNWLVRRRHLAWLRDSGCLDGRRSA